MVVLIHDTTATPGGFAIRYRSESTGPGFARLKAAPPSSDRKEKFV